MGNNPKVQVDVLADVTKLQKGFGQAEQSSSTLEKALKRLGPVGSVLQNVLDKVGLSSITSAAGIAAGITAGVGASVAAIERGIGKYVELGEKIRSYSVITGQSAEVSSRQVQAFEALGVSEDVAAAGMNRLAREADIAPGKLKAVGVEVARTATGSIDLNATMLNVIKAYQETSDAGQRAAIVFAAFGKGGAALIPILETNAGELNKLESEVRKVFTDDELKRIRDYKIAQQQLAQSSEDFWTALGERFLPAQKAATDGANEYLYVTQRVAEAQANGTLKARTGSQAAEAFADKVRAEYRAAQDAKTQIDALAEAQKAAAAAAEEAAKAEQDAVNADESVAKASLNATKAYIAVARSQATVDDAQKKYNEAVKQYGVNSAEARAAALDLNQAQVDQRDAYINAGEAAKQLVIDQEKAAGAAPDVVAETQAEIAQLQAMASALAPGSPLRVYLQQYIDSLKNDIPKSVTTAIGAGAAPGSGFTAGSTGAVGTAAAAPQAARTTTVNTTINVNGAQDPQATARAIAARIRASIIP